MSLHQRERHEQNVYYCRTHGKKFLGYETYTEHNYGRRFHSRGRGYMHTAQICKCCGFRLHSVEDMPGLHCTDCDIVLKGKQFREQPIIWG